MATETRERITDPERLSRLEGAHLHMATKADLAASEARVIAMVVETNEKIAETNQKIAETNERIVESESRLIRWGIGIAVTAFAAAASLVAAGVMILYRLLSS